jgi:hypothetical protein
MTDTVIGFEHREKCELIANFSLNCSMSQFDRLAVILQQAALLDRDKRELALDRMVANAEELGLYPKRGCSCETCRPITMTDMRMVVCETCGNKRCPKATNHLNECTGSNEPGQKGSSFEHCPLPEGR